VILKGADGERLAAATRGHLLTHVFNNIVVLLQIGFCKGLSAESAAEIVLGGLTHFSETVVAKGVVASVDLDWVEVELKTNLTRILIPCLVMCN